LFVASQSFGVGLEERLVERVKHGECRDIGVELDAGRVCLLDRIGDQVHMAGRRRQEPGGRPLFQQAGAYAADAVSATTINEKVDFCRRSDAVPGPLAVPEIVQSNAAVEGDDRPVKAMTRFELPQTGMRLYSQRIRARDVYGIRR